jgi:hypothetical protein
MADTCMFLPETAAETRPGAPFARTTLSLTGIAAPFVLRRDNVELLPAEAKSYQLFDGSKQIGGYPFALHHGIAFKRLRLAWNRIFAVCTPVAITALIDFLFLDHPAVAENAALCASLRQKMLAFRTAAGPNLATLAPGQAGAKTYTGWMTDLDAHVVAAADGAALTADEANAWVLILCWGSWNLTEGPKESIRVDDPINLLDDFTDCCPDQALKVRYRAVARLSVTVETIIASFDANANTFLQNPALALGWSTALLESLQVCAALTTAQRRMVSFDPRMWAPVRAYGSGKDKHGAAKFSDSEMITVVEQGVTCWKQYKCGRY